MTENTTKTTHRYPDTSAEVVDRLKSLNGIATKAQWERSALVYLLSAPGKPGPKPNVAEMRRNYRVSFSEMESWHIHGLTNRHTIAAYHRYWADAIVEGLAEVPELGGVFVEPDKEWPGFKKITEKDPDDEIAPPPVIPPRRIAAQPGTDRWDELIREGTESTDPWAPGDAAAEIFPPGHEAVASSTYAKSAENFEKYAVEIGVDVDTLWESRMLSLDWPAATRVPGASWAAHRELAHNRELLTPGMTEEAASYASFGEACRHIQQANIHLRGAIEAVLCSGEHFGNEDREYLRFRLNDNTQIWLGRLQAAVDGGHDGYHRYNEEHPYITDQYERRYGKAIPATEKYAEQREKEEELKAREAALQKSWSYTVVKYGLEAANEKFPDAQSISLRHS